MQRGEKNKLLTQHINENLAKRQVRARGTEPLERLAIKHYIKTNYFCCATSQFSKQTDLFGNLETNWYRKKNIAKHFRAGGPSELPPSESGAATITTPRGRAFLHSLKGVPRHQTAPQAVAPCDSWLACVCHVGGGRGWLRRRTPCCCCACTS